ncbi:hypothetical protein ACJ73_08386 [Blastomyces percursus]|uniref:Uncharacterized protein n=1 Tax=Blastomyces percursus TaxID=1658174 RepID=A0A1J9PWK2_9EURO|nr:hypothetical protein ACJ73_08386 [Blastomyces percursus]
MAQAAKSAASYNAFTTPSRSLHFKEARKIVENIAAKVPIITGIKLNGSEPHKSHDDPTDPKPVISFALYKSNKLNSHNRVASGHAHDDGTGHINFSSKYKQYRAITGMEYKPPVGQKKPEGTNDH